MVLRLTIEVGGMVERDSLFLRFVRFGTVSPTVDLYGVIIVVFTCYVGENKIELFRSKKVVT